MADYLCIEHFKASAIFTSHLNGQFKCEILVGCFFLPAESHYRASLNILTALKLFMKALQFFSKNNPSADIYCFK